MSGKKVKLAVAEFTATSPNAQAAISDSLRRVLIAELNKNSNFNIIDLKKPDDPGSPAYDLIAQVDVVEFEPQMSGGRSGSGGGGGAGSGVLGGFLGDSLNKAYVAFDLQINDANNNKVILQKTRIKGQATDCLKQQAGGVFSCGNIAALKSYQNAPMEKAINILINETLSIMRQAVPVEYYK